MKQKPVFVGDFRKDLKTLAEGALAVAMFPFALVYSAFYLLLILLPLLTAAAVLYLAVHFLTGWL